MQSVELQATASTIRAIRAAARAPIELFRVVSARPGEQARVSISALGDALEVEFSFPHLRAGWAKAMVYSCEIPPLFAFGQIMFSDDGQRRCLDPQQFECASGASTDAFVETVGPSTDERLSVRLTHDPRATELLAIPAIEAFLNANSWIGSPRSPVVEAVRLKVLAMERSLRTRQYPAGAQAQSWETAINGARLFVTCYLAEGQTGGEVRHAKFGAVDETRRLGRVPDGLSVDVVFHFDPAPSCLPEERAESEYRTAKAFLRASIERTLRSERANALQAGLASRAARAALVTLEQRRASLKRSDFVVVGGQLVHRVPQNENDLVCLFMKLASMREIPFECRILEYTAKKGIDALGDFRLSEHMVREEHAPIEFEHRFESFAEHEHPVGQVKLIVCWTIDDPDAPELRPTPFKWLMQYDSGPLPIPVAVVSRFPKVKIRGAEHG